MIGKIPSQKRTVWHCIVYFRDHIKQHTILRPYFFFDEVLNINQEIVRNMHNIPFLELNDHEVLKYQLYTVQARSGKKAEKDPT